MKRLVTTAIVACLALCGCTNTNTKSIEPDIENDGRFLAERGRVYIVIDTRTGVQYLAWEDNYGSEHFGSITALLNADGTVSIDERYGK